MSLRKVNFVEDEYYHIYNRGNSKKEIFHDKYDYFHFIKLMYICNNTDNIRVFNDDRCGIEVFNKAAENIVSIGAYCLMPNHFHFLITEKTEGGISKFMQKLSTAYVMYYNKKYKHTGSLFEGKFKSVHAGDDIQLKYLFSYIHLNPIKLIQKEWKERGIINKKESLNFLEDYEYSSYKDYIQKERIQKKVLNTKDFPNYFHTKEKFKDEIMEWLSFKTQ
jgi:putative transposase